jgi:hypothetical protein
MLTSLRCAKVVVVAARRGRRRGGLGRPAARAADHLAGAGPVLAGAAAEVRGLAGGQGRLDVDDLRIEGAGVGAALPNGGFSSGLDHWLSATDVPRLQIDLPLAVLWQQGALGPGGLAGLVALAAVRVPWRLVGGRRHRRCPAGSAGSNMY